MKLQRLRELHPRADLGGGLLIKNGFHFPEPEPEVVLQCLKNVTKGCTPGRTGWTPELLEHLLECPALAKPISRLLSLPCAFPIV